MRLQRICLACRKKKKKTFAAKANGKKKKRLTIDTQSSQVTMRSGVAIGKSTLVSWLVCCQHFSMNGDDDANKPTDRLMAVTRKGEI